MKTNTHADRYWLQKATKGTVDYFKICGTVEEDIKTTLHSTKSRSYKGRIVVDIEISPKTFWALLPAVNINISNKNLEFEWLCFGFYI